MLLFFEMMRNTFRRAGTWGAVTRPRALVVRSVARPPSGRALPAGGQTVGGEHVMAGIAHPGRRVTDRVQDLLHAGRDARVLGPALARRLGLGRAGEVEQVVAFSVVQLQRPGDALKDGVRGAGEVAAFHPDVVVDADSRKQRDLFSAQSCYPAGAAVGGQASLGGSDSGPPGGEELADLRSVVHDFTLGALGDAREVLFLPGRADPPTGPADTCEVAPSSWPRKVSCLAASCSARRPQIRPAGPARAGAGRGKDGLTDRPASSAPVGGSVITWKNSHSQTGAGAGYLRCERR